MRSDDFLGHGLAEVWAHQVSGRGRVPHRADSSVAGKVCLRT